MNNTRTPLRSKKLVFVLVLFVCQLTIFVLVFVLVIMLLCQTSVCASLVVSSPSFVHASPFLVR